MAQLLRRRTLSRRLGAPDLDIETRILVRCRVSRRSSV
jgi:hypothetical protein